MPTTGIHMLRHRTQPQRASGCAVPRHTRPRLWMSTTRPAANCRMPGCQPTFTPTSGAAPISSGSSAAAAVLESAVLCGMPGCSLWKRGIACLPFRAGHLTARPSGLPAQFNCAACPYHPRPLADPAAYCGMPERLPPSRPTSPRAIVRQVAACLAARSAYAAPLSPPGEGLGVRSPIDSKLRKKGGEMRGRAHRA